MTTLIKNCGLKTPEAIACASLTGAAFIGFVHYAPSPRHLLAEEIRALYAHVPPDSAKVAVLVNPDDALLTSLPAPDYWQVHDVLDPGRIAQITAQTGIPVITGLRVRAAEDLQLTAALEEVSAHLLFDAPAPGSGKTFDWSLLKGLHFAKPWFLAGGLNPENVGDAIRATHAPAVDVSSGIEALPGEKSLEKIAAFNAAVLQASQQ